MREAIVGLEAQFVLTTRNAEGEQCYDEGDYVTVEIRNRQGQDCTMKVQDNKDTRSVTSLKKPGDVTCQ